MAGLMDLVLVDMRLRGIDPRDMKNTGTRGMVTRDMVPMDTTPMGMKHMRINRILTDMP